MKKKLDSLGFPPRNQSHRDLLPWKIRPEHNSDELRHMLQAESRRRQGKELSEADRTLTSRLHELLFGRGKLMVVNYHPEVGFGLVMREDYDEDIIRQPRAPRYAEDAVEGRGRRASAAQASGDHDGVADAASARTRASGTG